MTDVAPAGGVLPAPPLLTQAAGVLRHAGLADPRREAMRIWRDLTRPAAAEFLAAVARRAGGEPLAYVTGRAGFRHLTLRADRRALIPRPETEQLVELALSLGRLERIAEVGTGSGCIALSLAMEGGYREVMAIDRSAEALTLAAENREESGARAVRLVRGDLTSPVAAASLDLLVSNPPYLTDAEWETLDPSVARWEPRDALAAGPDGLRETRALLKDGVRVVRTGGWIVLELDSRRARAVATMASALGWQDTRVIHDLFGRERFLLARRSEP